MLYIRRFLPFCLCLMFMAIGLLRIISGYAIFTQVDDEEAHIGAGMQMLDLHRYDYETLHPPLARMMIAALPYLNGLSPTRQDYANHDNFIGMWEIGSMVLHKNNAYFHNLTLARLGTLPFYAIALLTLWAWGKRFYDTGTAILATLLFSTTPIILGHAMLATTDMAITAMLTLALFTTMLWLERPSHRKSALVGVTAGLALLSKMSSLIFLPAAIKAIQFYKEYSLPKTAQDAYSRRFLFKQACIIIACLSLTVWCGYLFINFPEYLGFERLIDGFRALLAKQTLSNQSYFMGGKTAGLSYFPLMIFFKTPLAFSFLILSGIVILIREGRHLPAERKWIYMAPLIITSSILLISMMSLIHIGVRHVLPLYPFFALIASIGLSRLLQSTLPVYIKAGYMLLVLWHLAASALAHPYYLAYFNETITHPEEISLDSDLDWGQDLYLLAQEVKKRNIRLDYLYYWGHAKPAYFNLPSVNRCVVNTTAMAAKSGWYAISVTCLKTRNALELSWLKAYTPVARIGSSIMLYHIP